MSTQSRSSSDNRQEYRNDQEPLGASNLSILSSSSRRPSPRVHRLHNAKERKIVAAKIEARRLTKEIERLREIYVEENMRELLEHAAEIDEMERRHFFGIGQREYELGQTRATDLQSRRDTHADHMNMLQREIEANQKGRSELEKQYHRVVEQQVTKHSFDDAIHSLEALFRDQQIAVINQIRAKLRETLLSKSRAAATISSPVEVNVQS
ncbi:hypothetical protein V5O48_013086 [Marasmius crinis-equi]|uniref:Uncharacterized protein n=1 Tax=Marasmius crinis-equi TaxID=585013 RepID=A0ABR3F1G4_9AGAR